MLAYISFITEIVLMPAIRANAPTKFIARRFPAISQKAFFNCSHIDS
jgi:hypothetical protein